MGGNVQEIDPEQLSWVPRLVFEYPTAGLLIYLAIVILSIIVYNLGFAKPLPVLKKVVVYVALLIGCLVISLLAFMGAPIIEVLVIASIFLLVYKLRIRGRKSEEQNG